MFQFTLPEINITLPEINNIDPENIIVEKEIPIEKPPLLGAKVYFSGNISLLLVSQTPFLVV